MATDTIKITKQNTQMIAHRGLSGIERENTCAAFIAAGNRTYYGIETDIHRTSDGKFVVIHDHLTQRISPIALSVEASTLDMLQSIPVYDIDNKIRVDLKLPSLEEYLKICEKYDKVSVLELKSEFTKEEIVNILEIVKQYRSMKNMIFISFVYQNLCYCRELSAEASLQFLCGCCVDADLIAKLKAYRLDLDIQYSHLTQENIALLHSQGITVNCWTVDNPQDAQKLAQWGVDYITSNILE